MRTAIAVAIAALLAAPVSAESIEEDIAAEAARAARSHGEAPAATPAQPAYGYTPPAMVRPALPAPYAGSMRPHRAPSPVPEAPVPAASAGPAPNTDAWFAAEAAQNARVARELANATEQIATSAPEADKPARAEAARVARLDAAAAEREAARLARLAEWQVVHRDRRVCQPVSTFVAGASTPNDVLAAYQRGDRDAGWLPGSEWPRSDALPVAQIETSRGLVTLVQSFSGCRNLFLMMGW